MYFINARLSEKSAKGYAKFQFTQDVATINRMLAQDKRHTALCGLV
jgi:3-deoxy-D-manno-octulosonic-acid transferase